MRLYSPVKCFQADFRKIFNLAAKRCIAAASPTILVAGKPDADTNRGDGPCGRYSQPTAVFTSSITINSTWGTTSPGGVYGNWVNFIAIFV